MASFRREAANLMSIIAGIFSASMGLHGFLLSSRFIDGGVTGIAMLMEKVLGVPLPVLIPLFNLPFIALAFRRMGAAFAIRSIVAIGGLSLCLATVRFPDVTPDKLLTAVFGGLFIGAGIGFAMRGGAVLDGTEIAALLISRKVSFVRISDVVMAFNVVIFLAAVFFFDVESGLYSILTYVAATRTLDFILNGFEQFNAVTIISEKSAAILHRLRREVGSYAVIVGGRLPETSTDTFRRNVLMCIANRFELGKVTEIVEQADPDAFLSVVPLADVKCARLGLKGLH